MSGVEWLLDLLFPPKCPFCGRVVERTGVCGECQASLPWTEGEETVRTLAGGVRCAAPLWYRGAVRDGLLRYKFQGRSDAAGPLGELVARCAAEAFSGEFDTVSWVPVSKKRLRRRGYDQAELLARSACRAWDTRPVRLLAKQRHNPAQSGLEGVEKRWENVRGAYRALPEARGRRILLVDDICTTGATLLSCVKALEEAGAAEVLCCCAARAVPGGEEKVHSSSAE